MTNYLSESSFIFILIVSLSSCSLLHKNVEQKPNFIPSISHIMKGVTNCDIRILMDGLQEFQYDSDQQWPTTTIFVPDFYSKYNTYHFGYTIQREYVPFSLNILKTRIPFCVVNLILIGNQSLLQQGNEFKFVRTESISLYFVIGYQYYLTDDHSSNVWIDNFENTYTILVTYSGKTLETAGFKLLVNFGTYLNNFGLVFPSFDNPADQNMNICIPVQTIGADLSQTMCQEVGKSLVEIINECRTYSPFWYFGMSLRKEEEENNPFDRGSNKSIDFYLFRQLAHRENPNVTIYTTYSSFIYAGTAPAIIYGKLITGQSYQIFTKWTGLQWLTCHTDKFLGFGFYVTPFELNLWIGFLITMSTVVGVTWIYVKYCFKDCKSISFSPWLFVVATFFEETSSVPAKLEKKTFYRLSIGIWCLMVAILTNCYNGLMITGLNSPLPGSQIESFKDLLCDQSLFDAKSDFNTTQWVEKSKIDWYWNSVKYYNNEEAQQNPYESSNCFRIWSPGMSVNPSMSFRYPYNQLFWDLHQIYWNLRIINLSKQGIRALFSYDDKIMYSLLHLGHAREPRGIERIRINDKRAPTQNEIYVENQNEITKCEKKSAYISYSDEIELEMYFLGRNYADKNFYTGQDLIKKQSEGLLFYNALNTKIVSYYRWLVDSGIYERLEEEKLARRIKLRKNIRQNMQERKPKGVSSLEGGLVTLFILCGALISLVVTVFTVECHTKSGRIFAKCILHMSAILKYCRRKRQRERNAAFLKHIVRRKIRKIHVQTTSHT